MSYNMIDGYSNEAIVAHASELKASGVHAVGLYLFEESAFKQRLTLETVQRLSETGIAVVSVFEQDPTSAAYFQRGRGSRDAASAHAQMQAVGQPRGSAVYFTVDYDASRFDFEAITRYFVEIRAVLRPYYDLGCYGGGDLLDSLKAAGVIEKLWLSQSKGFNGWERVSKYADIVQGPSQKMYGIDVDVDQTNGKAGGWTAGNKPAG